MAYESGTRFATDFFSNPSSPYFTLLSLKGNQLSQK
jgi:hypothetical protein